MISIMGADGKSYGPVSTEQIRDWITQGRASLDTLAQRQGEHTWHPLSEFPELNPSLPPPLPRTPPPLCTASEEQALRERAAALYAGENLLATRFQRLVAAGIDTTLSLFFALPGLFMLTLGILQDNTPLEEVIQNGFAGHEASMGFIMFGMIIPAIVQILLLSFRGQTVGKYLLQLRIVRVDDEAKAGFVKAVVMRGMIPALIGTLPYIGFSFTLFNVFFIFRDDRRCLHDHIAGTKVIKLE